MTLAQPVDAIVLNAWQIKFGAVTAQVGGKTLPAEVTLDPALQQATFHFPRQLPAGVAHFTGRADHLEALTGLAGRAGATVVVSAIGGTAGIGKTALAVHWAQQVADQFPDGQLFADLHGFSGSRAPVTSA